MYSSLINRIDGEKDLEQCQIFNDISFSSPNAISLGILLTPICDIVQNEADHLIFCAILPYKNLFLATIEEDYGFDQTTVSDRSLSNNKKNQMLVPIKNIIGNRLERFHWLGQLPDQEGYWYIDYQLIETFPLEQTRELKEKRLLELISPLNQSVSVRFSNYLGRIGLPFDTNQRDEQANKVLDFLKE